MCSEVPDLSEVAVSLPWHARKATIRDMCAGRPEPMEVGTPEKRHAGQDVRFDRAFPVCPMRAVRGVIVDGKARVDNACLHRYERSAESWVGRQCLRQSGSCFRHDAQHDAAPDTDTDAMGSKHVVGTLDVNGRAPFALGCLACCGGEPWLG